MRRPLSTLILLSFAATAAGAPTPCLIEPDAVVDLGAPVVGVVTSIAVERGDRVKKGQVIATLDAGVEQRGVQLASERSKDQAEMHSAAASMEHAKRERQRAQQMYEKKLVSRQYVDKATTEASIAEYRFYQAKAKQRQSDLELKLANAKLLQRKLKSPIEGIITERYASMGQRIQDDALVRIVKTDPLRVEVVVPAEKYNQFSKGMNLSVQPELPGLESQTAEVYIIDRVIDSASNSFRMTLRLPNGDGSIPAGARCTVNLDPDDTETKGHSAKVGTSEHS